MPIKSKAQRRKFAELLVEGQIEPETYERWNREAGGTELPERVRRRKTATKKSAKKKSAKKKSARKTSAQKASSRKTTRTRAKKSARTSKKR